MTPKDPTLSVHIYVETGNPDPEFAGYGLFLGNPKDEDAAMKLINDFLARGGMFNHGFVKAEATISYFTGYGNKVRIPSKSIVVMPEDVVKD